VSWLDRTDEQCQPCENYKHAEFEGDSPTPHECYKGCGGRVYFCDNCKRDHHGGGYNTCISLGCPFNHPACMAALRMQNSREERLNDPSRRTLFSSIQWVLNEEK